MKKLIKILAGLVVLVVAVVAAGVAIISAQDFNGYRSLLAEQVEAATGRKLTIEGDLKLGISLHPALSVEDVTFANADWGSQPDMVTADRFAAVVELLPLLTGDVRVERLELSGVNVLLETDDKGRANWNFAGAPTADSGAGDAGDKTLPVVKSVRMNDVTLNYRDGETGKTERVSLQRLRLSAEGPERPLTVAGKMNLNGEDIALDGTLGSINTLIDDKTFPVRMDVSALGGIFKLDGTIRKPREVEGYNIGITARGASLRDVVARAAKLAGQEAPPLADRAFDVTAAVRDDGDRIHLDGLALKIGDSDLSGRLSMAPLSPRLDLKADLTSERFDVADLVVLSKDDTAPAADMPSDGRIFPNDPLPFDALGTVDAEVDLNAGMLIESGMQAQDISVKLLLNHGRLMIRPFSADLFGNKLSGNLVLDTKHTPASLDLAVEGKGIDYGRLLAVTTGNASLKGKLDLALNMESHGNTVRALMAAMNGHLRVVSQDGRIESGALGFFSGNLLGAVPFLGNKNDAQSLECAVADFTVKDGVAVPNALLAETGGLNVIGSGTVDLRDEKLNLLFDPRAKSTSFAKMAQIGIRVGGTFLKPAFSPDAGSVVKGAASTALGIATGGLSTLAQMALGSVVDAVDNTDYCKAAMNGKIPTGKVPPKNQPQDRSGTQPPPAQENTDNAATDAIKGIGSTLNGLLGN